MTSITLSTNNIQFVHLFESMAKVLGVSFEKHSALSKSMQKAMDEEKKGQVTKLVNRKNAVAEIVG